MELDENNKSTSKNSTNEKKHKKRESQFMTYLLNKERR
jgi:hypothetical protein